MELGRFWGGLGAVLEPGRCVSRTLVEDVRDDQVSALVSVVFLLLAAGVGGAAGISGGLADSAAVSDSGSCGGRRFGVGGGDYSAAGTAIAVGLIPPTLAGKTTTRRGWGTQIVVCAEPIFGPGLRGFGGVG